MNPADLNNLVFISNSVPKTDTVFLKLLQKGKHVHLLSYTDKIKTRYFIQEQDGSPAQELHYGVVYGASQKEYKTQKGFVQQLNLLAVKYGVSSAKLEREIETAAYNLYTLNKIVSSLNGSLEKDKVVSTAASPEDKSRNFRFYVGIAASRNVIAIDGRHFYSNADVASPQVSPQVSVGADLFVNRHIQKMLLRVEVSASNSSQTFVETESMSIHATHTYQMSQQMAGLSPQLIYNFYNKDNFKVYAGLGAELYFSHIADNTETSQYYYPSISGEVGRTEVKEDFLDINSLWAAYSFRTGVVLKRRYELAAMYMPPASMTNYSSFSLNMSTVSIGAHYLFSR